MDLDLVSHVQMLQPVVLCSMSSPLSFHLSHQIKKWKGPPKKWIHPVIVCRLQYVGKCCWPAENGSSILTVLQLFLPSHFSITSPPSLSTFPLCVSFLYRRWVTQVVFLCTLLLSLVSSLPSKKKTTTPLVFFSSWTCQFCPFWLI